MLLRGPLLSTLTIAPSVIFKPRPPCAEKVHRKFVDAYDMTKALAGIGKELVKEADASIGESRTVQMNAIVGSAQIGAKHTLAQSPDKGLSWLTDRLFHKFPAHLRTMNWFCKVIDNYTNVGISENIYACPYTTHNKDTLAFGRQIRLIPEGMEYCGENLPIELEGAWFVYTEQSRKPGAAERYLHDTMFTAEMEEVRIQNGVNEKLPPHFKYLRQRLRSLDAGRIDRFSALMPERYCEVYGAKMTADKLLTLVLNLGTQKNHQRLPDGFNLDDVSLNEAASIFGKAEDWSAIQGV